MPTRILRRLGDDLIDLESLAWELHAAGHSCCSQLAWRIHLDQGVTVSELAIDYAWSRPNPAGIKAAGYTTVMRYLCIGDSVKELSTTEAAALHAAGLSIGLVWETTTDRAGQGYAAGQQDAQTARAHAAALGYPAQCPIFFAVDYDAQVAAVVPYFKGVASAGLGHPVGVYGSCYVVDGIMAGGLATYAWQTMAWSGGQVSAKAHLYQTLNHSVTLPGSSNNGWDENRVLQPFPCWTASGHTNSPTTPTTGGFLMSLTDAQQQEMHDRIMGGIPAGSSVGRKDATGAAARVLDTGDGGYLLAQLPALVAAEVKKQLGK